MAIVTGLRSAVSSSGARAIPETPSVTNCSTIAICWARSFSLSGPFQTRSTSRSFAAARAPASTDFQKTCVVPLGIIAIVSRCESAACTVRPKIIRITMRNQDMVASPGRNDGGNNATLARESVESDLEDLKFHRARGHGDRHLLAHFLAEHSLG